MKSDASFLFVFTPIKQFYVLKNVDEHIFMFLKMLWKAFFRYFVDCIKKSVKALLGSAGGVVVPTAPSVEGSMPEDACEKL